MQGDWGDHPAGVQEAAERADESHVLRRQGEDGGKLGKYRESENPEVSFDLDVLLQFPRVSGHLRLPGWRQSALLDR